MDYKKEIIKLLDKINSDRLLKTIYGFVNGIVKRAGV